MRTSIFQNANENNVRIYSLKISISSLGLPGSFLIVYDITNYVPRKPQKASRKPTGIYKKIQGRNPYNIFVAFLEN